MGTWSATESRGQGRYQTESGDEGTCTRDRVQERSGKPPVQPLSAEMVMRGCNSSYHIIPLGNGISRYPPLAHRSPERSDTIAKTRALLITRGKGRAAHGVIGGYLGRDASPSRPATASLMMLAATTTVASALGLRLSLGLALRLTLRLRFGLLRGLRLCLRLGFALRRRGRLA